MIGSTTHKKQDQGYSWDVIMEVGTLQKHYWSSGSYVQWSPCTIRISPISELDWNRLELQNLEWLFPEIFCFFARASSTLLSIWTTCCCPGQVSINTAVERISVVYSIRTMTIGVQVLDPSTRGLRTHKKVLIQSRWMDGRMNEWISLRCCAIFNCKSTPCVLCNRGRVSNMINQERSNGKLVPSLKNRG